ncbi:MAG TPA: PEP-CTERM system TPR-repeat protein PrsT [Rhodospirillum rubrum]|nr:PEP-CTERM system TPR-repeat protein PrsT [Rhodospirillum rubrum]
MARSLKRFWSTTSALALVLALAACNDEAKDKARASAKAYDSAITAWRAGDQKAALIHVSNALKAAPDNRDAKILMGEITLSGGDVWSGEKLLKEVRDGGAPAETWLRPLAKSLILQQKFDEALTLARSIPETELVGAVKTIEGLALFGKGQDGAARLALDKALDIDPADKDALIGAAQIETMAGHQDAARALLARAAAAAPDDVDVLVAQADTALSANDPAAAEGLFSQAAARLPLNPLIRLSLAQAQIEAGKNAEARQTLNTVLADIPAHPWALYLRGLTAYRTNDMTAADKDLTAALALAKTLRPAIFLAGVVKYNIGEYEQASRLLAGLTETEGKSNKTADAVRAAALLKLGRDDESYRLLRPLAAGDGETADLYAMAAVAAQGAAAMADSEGYYQKAVVLRPDDPALLTNLGIVKLARGDTTAGEDTLNRAAELEGDDKKALLLLFSSLLQKKDFDKAEALAGDTKRKYPDRAWGWTMDGMIQASRGDTAMARAAFETAVRKEPTAGDAVRNLALTALQSGDTEGARGVVEGYLRTNAGDSAMAMIAAAVANKRNDLVAVEKWLRQALERDPANMEAASNLASLLTSTSRPQAAIIVAQDALRISPDTPAVMEALGKAQLLIGDYTAAADVLRRAVAIKPSGLTYYLLATAYLNLNDPPRLKEALESVVKLQPDHVDSRVMLATMIVDGGALSDAKTAVEGVTTDFPGDPRAQEVRARYLAKAEGPASAITFLEASLTDPNTRPRNLVMLLASAYNEKGDGAKASSLLEDWVAKNPDDYPGRLSLATQQIAANQLEKAKTTLEKGLERVPNDWIARNNLAEVMLRLGQTSAAYDQIVIARRSGGPQPALLDTEGQILLKMGKASEAVEILRLATIDRNAPPTYGLHLAQALAAAGKKDEAGERLRALLDKNNAFEGAEQARALLSELQG